MSRLSFERDFTLKTYLDNLNQDSSVYDDFQNKYIPTEPQKWSVGYTYTCKDERLIPKKQQYRDYYFLR